jgi:hypothetical protein
MINKKLKSKESLYLYLIMYLFLIVRYFILEIPFGYGLGDLIYITLFSCFLLLSLLIVFKVKNRKILFVTSILNILMSIYILLMMFIFRGIER